MPELMVAVSPADLLINPSNPRLPQPNMGQREIVRALAQLAPAKNSAPGPRHSGAWHQSCRASHCCPRVRRQEAIVVLEGNRRVAAIKILENPELLDGAIKSALLVELRRLSRQYQDNPIEELSCVILKDMNEAAHWIELRHTGENEGAGNRSLG